MSTTTLYYIHDPMCSWCWGFQSCWTKVKQQLPDTIEIKYCLGGLAPDTDQPMPEEMQINIRDTWRSIQKEIPGTKFNFDFWDQCQPRRSTYPACRAVIAARLQGAEEEMNSAIQQAYYCHGQNPSDNDTLIQCARRTGLDIKQFTKDFYSTQLAELFRQEMLFCQTLQVYSYPSLVLQHQQKNYPINIDYTHPDLILKDILNIISTP